MFDLLEGIFCGLSCVFQCAGSGLDLGAVGELGNATPTSGNDFQGSYQDHHRSNFLLFAPDLYYYEPLKSEKDVKKENKTAKVEKQLAQQNQQRPVQQNQQRPVQQHQQRPVQQNQQRPVQQHQQRPAQQYQRPAQHQQRPAQQYQRPVQQHQQRPAQQYQRPAQYYQPRAVQQYHFRPVQQYSYLRPMQYSGNIRPAQQFTLNYHSSNQRVSFTPVNQMYFSYSPPVMIFPQVQNRFQLNNNVYTVNFLPSQPRHNFSRFMQQSMRPVTHNALNNNNRNSQVRYR